jgi:hypothetical protein
VNRKYSYAFYSYLQLGDQKEALVEKEQFAEAEAIKQQLAGAKAKLQALEEKLKPQVVEEQEERGSSETFFSALTILQASLAASSSTLGPFGPHAHLQDLVLPGIQVPLRSSKGLPGPTHSMLMGRWGVLLVLRMQMPRFETPRWPALVSTRWLIELLRKATS